MIVSIGSSIQLPCGCYHTLKHDSGDRQVPCGMHKVYNVVTVKSAEMLNVEMRVRDMGDEE